MTLNTRSIIALALLICGGCASQPVRVAMDPQDEQAHVSVMTFNVNYGLAHDIATTQVITEATADVIFLQETTAEWEAAIRSSLSSDFSYVAFTDHPGAGGLGILSRLPVTRVEYLPQVNWFPAVRVVLDTPVGPLQVLSVHLRPPISDGGNPITGYLTTGPVRESEIETFATSLDPEIPTLIVGDFNEHENGRALRWLRQHGMRSALPEFSPYAKTWRWQTSIGTLRGRYDHIVYDARLEPLRVEVLNAGRSDHLPVVGVFALSDQVFNSE